MVSKPNSLGSVPKQFAAMMAEAFEKGFNPTDFGVLIDLKSGEMRWMDPAVWTHYSHIDDDAIENMAFSFARAADDLGLRGPQVKQAFVEEFLRHLKTSTTFSQKQKDAFLNFAGPELNENLSTFAPKPGETGVEILMRLYSEIK